MKVTTGSSVKHSNRLIDLARQGCADSFRQLVELHHKPIRMYLAKHVRCSADVDDIAQDVFVVAFRQIDHFRGDSKFSTWLTGIAHNKALEFLRAKINEKKKQSNFQQANIAKHQITSLKIQRRDFEFLEDQLSALELCLEQLPARSKSLIERHYFDQQSAVSIASEADEASGTVRMKLLRIRRILQKCISNRFESNDGK